MLYAKRYYLLFFIYYYYLLLLKEDENKYLGALRVMFPYNRWKCVKNWTRKGRERQSSFVFTLLTGSPRCPEEDECMRRRGLLTQNDVEVLCP